MHANALPGIIDVDTHVVEPPDLWTSRMNPKWGDQIPRVRWDDKNQDEGWFVGDHRLQIWIAAYPYRLRDLHQAGEFHAGRRRVFHHVKVSKRIIPEHRVVGMD